MRLLLLLLSFLILSCNEKTDSSIRGEIDNTGIMGLIGNVSNDEPYFAYNESDFERNPTPSQRPSSLKGEDQKIIKTARLRFETQDLKNTQEQVDEVIKQVGGYIQNDTSGKDRNQLYHRLTVRIPTQNFQNAINGIAKGVVFFDEKTISQQDVTEEFIDINARLKAKRALEERYLTLLQKAKNVKEMLDIERELAEIREEIEAKQGRLNFLKNQVALSTLHIHFYKVTAEEGITQSYGRKIINSVKNGWNKVSQFFLTLLSSWPFLILVLAGVFFIRRWIRKRKN